MPARHYWVDRERHSTSRLLKKSSMAFSTSQSEKRGFRIAPIFNGLQPSKMSVALYRLAGCRKTAFFNSLLELWQEIAAETCPIPTSGLNK
jgi:hypothetical protein